MKTNYALMLCLFVVFFNFQALSQERFQLVQQPANQELSFAHFQYGKQKGLSDESGFITLKYEPETQLEISHLSIGYQVFQAVDVALALKAKKLVVKSDGSITLQPVTVIALRPPVSGKEVLKVAIDQQLSHDAGSFLMMNPMISGIRKSSSSSIDPVLRGFKYEQLTIVTDGGGAATAACPNRMDPPSSQVSLNMIERVEILKGPHALRYGNSFGGTLHFLSPEPIFSSKVRPLARVSSGYESNGNIFRVEGMAGLSTKSLDWQLFAASSQGDDYLDGSGNKVAAGFSRISLGSTLSAQLSPKQVLRLSVQHNVAKDVDFPSLPMDLRSDKAWLANARYAISFNNTPLKSVTTTAYATFVDHFMDNRLKNLNPRMMNAETPATTSNIGGRSEAFFSWPATKLYVGVDGRREEAEGTRKREFLMGPMAGKTLFDNAWQHGMITKASVFGEYRRSLNAWAVIASMRLEMNRAQVKQASDVFLALYPDPTADQINPSWSAGITRNWSSRVSTSLWLGHSTRSASITERFINFFSVGLDAYEMVGNPTLKPEKNSQLDADFQFHHGGTSVIWSVYVAFLKDFISAERDTTLQVRIATSPGVRRFVNIDDALMTGFELNVQQTLPARLKANLSIAYVYGQNTKLNTALPEIPPFDLRLSLSASYFNNKLKPELRWRMVMEQNRVSEEFSETKTPAFMLVDLVGNFQINTKLQLRGGVQNLLDEAYHEHLTRALNGSGGLPLLAPGRSFFVALSYNLTP